MYVLLCSDASYYTGMTNNLFRRLHEHNSGRNLKAYTFTRRPVKMVFFESFNDFGIALRFEKQIKGWSRGKKEALIKGDYHELVRLSKNYKQFGKPRKK
ncbi:MAG: GIY-YIG nuclease family protein [Saprospiraceae bacterium]|nr:GIY-YIG nuclease family protein [Saprospiraceae bacterium]